MHSTHLRQSVAEGWEGDPSTPLSFPLPDQLTTLQGLSWALPLPSAPGPAPTTRREEMLVVGVDTMIYVLVSLCCKLFPLFAAEVTTGQVLPLRVQEHVL